MKTVNINRTVGDRYSIIGAPVIWLFHIATAKVVKDSKIAVTSQGETALMLCMGIFPSFKPSNHGYRDSME